LASISDKPFRMIRRFTHLERAMSLRLLPFLAATALMTGCAFNVAPYGASVKNVEALKAASIKPVSVARFEAAKPGQASISCRAAGSVKVEPSFETYIEKAFIDELKLAGLYDPNSSLKLSGKLEQIDFSSGISDGNWTFTLVVSNARNESFSTQSKFPFSGSFIADKACQEVAQAFGPAVQKLIEDVVRNPKFKQLAS